MADSNLTGLTAATGRLGTDLLYLARSPFGLTDDRKITVANFMKDVVSSVTDVAGSGTLTITADIQLVRSADAGDAAITIAAGSAGQKVMLVGQDNTKTITLTNSATLVLNNAADITLGQNDIVNLVYIGTAWIQATPLSYNN